MNAFIRIGLLLLAAAAPLTPAFSADAAHDAAAGFELLTPQQVEREQQALAEARGTGEALAKGGEALTRGLRTRAILPAIKVLAPNIGAGAMKSPLRIELQFEPAGEAKIDVRSFHVFYGLFRVDLTDKIRENAVITEKGLLAENARIPSGDHRLILQIADEMGRKTETELRFRVEE